jgi:hypothetical protein
MLTRRSAPQLDLVLELSTMNAIEPTYFLYAGRLFHESALPALREQLRAAEESPPSSRCDGAPTERMPQPLRPEDPSPEGPEGEPVGEEDEDGGNERNVESKPSPGPGVPIVPEHGSPDANPIDPRVF